MAKKSASTAKPASTPRPGRPAAKKMPPKPTDAGTRSPGECMGCLFWRFTFAGSDLKDLLGECHRHAPDARSRWPEVWGHDGCGDFLERSDCHKREAAPHE
jgi:hypothetical protein